MAGGSLKQDIGRRLVEYFVVVSSVERKPEDEKKKKNQPQSSDDPNLAWKTESLSQEDVDEFAEYTFRPTITARYPLHDHHDNPLHDNVTFFCHPTGAIHLRTENFMPKVGTEPNKVTVDFHYVILRNETVISLYFLFR